MLHNYCSDCSRLSHSAAILGLRSLGYCDGFNPSTFNQQSAELLVRSIQYYFRLLHVKATANALRLAVGDQRCSMPKLPQFVATSVSHRKVTDAAAVPVAAYCWLILENQIQLQVVLPGFASYLRVICTFFYALTRSLWQFWQGHRPATHPCGHLAQFCGRDPCLRPGGPKPWKTMHLILKTFRWFYCIK